MITQNNIKLYIKIIFICLLITNILFCQKIDNDLEENDSLKISPTRAMVLSGIMPGLGQIYTRSPIRAGIAVGAEAFCIYKINQYSQNASKVDRAINEIGENNWDNMDISTQKDSVKAITGFNLEDEPWKPEERFKKTLWWLAGIHILNILDAYVQAHLINFPEDKIELSSKFSSQMVGLNLSIKF